MIDEKTTESELDAMGKAGMRGIRLNLATGGTNGPTVAGKRFQAGSGGRHEKPQVARPAQYQPRDHLGDQGQLMASPVPLSSTLWRRAADLDGSSRVLTSSSIVVRLAYVKISGAYRSSKLGPEYKDCIPLARR